MLFRSREVRFERAQGDRGRGGEQAVIDLLAELVEQGMSAADAGSENGRCAARWKAAHALKVEEESSHGDEPESRLDQVSRGFVNGADESQGQVQLLRLGPAHAV